ncbi:fibronectin type III domain-containing protein [Catellatospora sichuanensis]|uniref:fibronectin type III domain-containing protein n=1 Tax=Catellatospora sichuanensis TaxID=1969805 RepID=UPI001FED1044|nr:fibronectin type III domain-containing protein [Catellatospora sichuanensis]
MADLSPSAITRRARTKGGVVTIVTVLAMLAAVSLTWFGISANDQVSAGYDSSSWLWSLTRGELARVNGLTGKVDTRTQALAVSQGHYVQVSQSDRYLIVRDQHTGRISALDPATLQLTASQESQAGLGVSVALHNQAAFVIDPVQGVVRQLDPATLQPIGEPLRFPPGITGGHFDGTGRLWLAIPSQGTVSAITPAPLTPPSGGTGGSGPSQVRTEPVAEAFHDLALSALDDGVAVLDQTNGSLTLLRGDELKKVEIAGAAGGELPDRSTGKDIAVTVVEGRKVYVIAGEQVNEFTVPGAGGTARPAVAWAGLFYIADDAAGKVYAIDREGKLVNTIEAGKPGGRLDLEVRENQLFINAPGASTARVVNDKHQVRVVDKFNDDVVGGDPPPVAPPPPPKPQIGKPGAPRNVTAASGDSQVRLSWGKAAENGSKITKYVVEGDGRTWTVGARNRSLVVDKLTNGKTYTFTVYAVNGKGSGPSRKSNPVMPTGDVPDPPTGVKAVEKPDGTVEVSWTAANGQGRKITRYEVTAVNAGSGALIGTTPGATKLVVKDGELEYGTQYAFTVVAVNDKGAGSEVSEPSGSVVPFNKPEQVRSLSAATVGTEKGTIRVAWETPADNGRQITGYKVTAGGKTQTVTATNATLDGFGDGEIVGVDVAAVNEAGTGPKDTTSAKTIADATVSNVSAGGATYKGFTVNFAFNDGGGTATCTVTINGAARAVGCNTGAGGYAVNEVATDSAFTITVSVKNATGQTATSAPVTVRTKRLNGTIRCVGCSNGIGIYSNSRQQSNEAVGDAQSGDTFKAFCWKQGTAGNQSGDAELFAAGENSNKRSDKWIEITYRGNQRYVPFIWLNLDDGDDYNDVPQC